MINYIEVGYGLHEFLNSNGVYLEQLDGVWTANVPDADVNALIEQYNPWPVEKAKKLEEINNWFKNAVAQLTAGIPQEEKDSWATQVNEANGIIPLQMLPVMANARGITVEELIQRVKTKAGLFAQYYGAIQGKRDAVEDAIKALPDSGELHRLPELWGLSCTD